MIAPPIENPELVGHGAAEALLRGALESGRLPHAWLITGPKGVGKATLAHRFARYVLARGGAPGVGDEASAAGGLFADAGIDLPEAAPASPGGGPEEGLYLSPDDPVFQRIRAGGHADLLVVERGVDEKTGKRRGAILVDDVRGVRGFLRMTAGEGGWRIVVIDSADEMNVNAANAVLKVLEEPPDRSLLLLVSHNPGRLLPTIVSRCRRLTLRPPAPAEISAFLADNLPDVPAETASVLASLAGGSIGAAIDLAENGGLDLFEEISGLFRQFPDGVPAAKLHDLAGRLGRAGQEDAFDTFTRLTRWWLERLVVAAAGGPVPDHLDRDLVARLGAAGGLDRWLEVWEKTSRIFDRTPAINLDRKQVSLNALIEIGGVAGRRS